MRKIAKVDKNQKVIVDALTRCGCSVESLATVGDGVPDLLVGRAGVNYLLEVKADKGSLTPAQVRWHAEYRGRVAIVRTVDDALRVVGLAR